MRKWTPFILFLVAAVLAFSLQIARHSGPAPAAGMSNKSAEFEPSTKAQDDRADVQTPITSIASSSTGIRKDLSVVVERETGTTLFETLASDEFRKESGWRRLSASLQKRLDRPLPARDGDGERADSLDREMAARLGLLKALGNVSISPSSRLEFKNLLFTYLLSGKRGHWLLQREAAHALIRQRIPLSGAEEVVLIRSLDIRARGLASYSDAQIISRVIERAR
jgi:hypothetical protein